MERVLLLVALLWSGPSSDLPHRTASAAKWINSFAGPFISVVGRFSDCPSGRSENLIYVQLKAQQFRNKQADAQNQLQKFTGNVTVTIPLVNKGMLYIKAASRSNNQWKENAQVLKFRDGICKSMMDYLPDFSRKVYRIEPDDMRTNCIIPKGVYTVDETPINFSVPKLTVFPYGTWRLEVGVDFGTEAKPRNVLCFLMELFTVPKL